MHTEEEAKKKWCPQARNGEGYTFKNESGEQSQQSFSNADATCIASNCMMWRWVESKPSELKGRCGLAGRVE